jgi:prolipoprotein diacylglyceryltransferase
VGICPAVRLRVKTLDLAVSTAVVQCVIILLVASSWSPDSTRSRLNISGVKFRFFIFCVVSSLICFVRVSYFTLYWFSRLSQMKKPISRRKWIVHGHEN